MVASGIREDPIFVLGMGRCGSTFLQHALCQVQDVWIWGEHDEMLSKLFDWYAWVSASEGIERSATQNARSKLIASFPYVEEADANAFAWINGFSKHDVNALLREIIPRLFALNLPAGKTRWGFKEIRYNQHNFVVDRLLELFPLARVVYVMREPQRTIEGSLFSWHGQEIEAVIRGDAGALDALGHAYFSRSQHWLLVANYFIGLGERTGRVFMLPIEQFEEKREALEEFLSLKFPAELVRLTNKGSISREDLHPVVQSVFQHAWKNTKPSIAALAQSYGYQV